MGLRRNQKNAMMVTKQQVMAVQGALLIKGSSVVRTKMGSQFAKQCFVETESTVQQEESSVMMETSLMGMDAIVTVFSKLGLSAPIRNS